jgi:hypothetical protein
VFVIEQSDEVSTPDFQEIFQSGLGLNESSITNFTMKEREPIEIFKDKFTQNGELTLVFSQYLYDLSHYPMLNLTYVNENID